MKNILIASTSTLYNSAYLEYLLPELALFFKATPEIIFIPYAKPGGISYNEYTLKVQNAFKQLEIAVKGLHTFSNPIKALEQAKGIFVGGGNTFLLVHTLYKNDLMLSLSKTVKNGIPYLGTSAGSNICGLTMQTTNDMPIIHPPSFKTLGLVPFNINPHYLDANKNFAHMGETREMRIKEFHSINTQPVIGLREGSWLHVNNKDIILKGNPSARIFEKDKEPYEVTPETNIYKLFIEK